MRRYTSRSALLQLPICCLGVLWCRVRIESCPAVGEESNPRAQSTEPMASIAVASNATGAAPVNAVPEVETPIVPFWPPLTSICNE